MQYKVIKNPTRYKKKTTKAALKVPVYDCIHARRQRQESMKLRIAQEIKDYNESGGAVVFATLTYSPRFRPYYIAHTPERMYHIPCFNKGHQSLFLKKLLMFFKRNLDYKGNKSRQYVEGQDLPFRYTWASEYGPSDEYIDDHGNKRIGQHVPHYHILLYFPKVLKDQLDEYQIRFLVERSWPYGEVRWSDNKRTSNKGLFVEHEFAGIYVSEYCTKDLEYYNNPDVEQYLYPGAAVDEHGHVINKYDLKIDEARLKAFKVVAPFFTQSHHIGEGLKKKYQTFEDFKEGVDLDLLSDRKEGKRYKYRCPLYIQRKTLLYYDKESKRYIHTDKGQDFKALIKEQNLPKQAKKLLFDVSHLGLHQKLTDSDIRQFKEFFQCETVKDLSERITSILVDYDTCLRYLCYNLSWSGRSLPMEIYDRNSDKWPYDFYQRQIYQCRSDETDRITSMSSQDFFNETMSLYRESLDNLTFDEYVDVGYYHIRDFPEYEQMYDSLPCFNGFNEVESILNKIEDIRHQKNFEEYLRVKNEHKLLKAYANA